MDTFLVANIIRPHAYRTMDCKTTPFLVTGNEPFLENKNFKFWADAKKKKQFPVILSKIEIHFYNGKPIFQYQQHGKSGPIENGLKVLEQLSRTGAYTHATGRYWSYRTLTEQPKLLKALARRYPHILIDEAQDIGTIHQAILELLAQEGSIISLIGDPCQGIYEFAGADGKFLIDYGQENGVKSFGLTCNYRSVPNIVTLANSISRRKDSANRPASEELHGAFFVGYQDSDIEQNRLVNYFCSAINDAKLQKDCSAIICRSNEQINKINGVSKDIGQGVIKDFAFAAIRRDKYQDYRQAFKTVAGCIPRLMDAPPPKLANAIMQPACEDEIRLRREVWKFIRNASSGLPHATLQADADWHQLLRERVKELLQRISGFCNLNPVEKIGNKLKKTKLPSCPLISPSAIQEAQSIRVDTVHKVKGG